MNIERGARALRGVLPLRPLARREEAREEGPLREERLTHGGCAKGSEGFEPFNPLG